MEENAKKIVQCDSCKQTIAKTGEEEIPEAIEATLNMPNGETKDFNFCGEECLRTFLNSRKKKFAKASVEIRPANNLFSYYL